ncbi:hypothetical protein CYMTET_52939, partial [Cymbomonas tetramitiformis]
MPQSREFVEMYQERQTSGSVMNHFRDFFNVIDFLSFGILLCTISLWIRVLILCHHFDIEIRYDVYKSTTGFDENGGHVNWLQWSDAEGSELQEVTDRFSELIYIGDQIYLYRCFSGMSICLMLMRVLKLMDFHPDIGMVTRTISEAGTDLTNFSILFVIILALYTCMGHLLFGAATEIFSTYARSLNTCFVMMLGDAGFAAEIPDLGGRTAQFSGYMFFYSYMVLVFFILLSALLAIIVAAMDNVKAKNRRAGTKSADVPSDVADMLTYLYSAACSKWSGEQSITEPEMVKLVKIWRREMRRAGWATSRNVVKSEEKYLRVEKQAVSTKALEEGVLALLEKYGNGDIKRRSSLAIGVKADDVEGGMWKDYRAAVSLQKQQRSSGQGEPRFSGEHGDLAK